MILLGKDFWVASGWQLLDKGKDGWLKITDDFLAAFFARPELAPIEESCQKEIDLNKKLILNPKLNISENQLNDLKDKDAAFNYKMVLNFRDFLLNYKNIEEAYVAVAKGHKINFPPLFVDHLVHVIVRSILDGWIEPIHLRAGEILFREQSVTLDNGKIMLADRATVQFKTQQESSLKREGNKSDIIEIDVLTEDTSDEYWERCENFDTAINIAFSEPALEGFSRVLESWVSHFFKLSCQIRPMQKIDDDKWRWHIGLDTNSTLILNDLYNGKKVEEERQKQILALFSLKVDNSKVFKDNIGEYPIYLALSMNPQGTVKCKPQNLLVNLPINN